MIHNAIAHYKNERRLYAKELDESRSVLDDFIVQAGEIVLRAVQDEVRFGSIERPINIKRDLNIELRDVVEKFRDEIWFSLRLTDTVNGFDKLIAELYAKNQQ